MKPTTERIHLDVDTDTLERARAQLANGSKRTLEDALLQLVQLIADSEARQMSHSEEEWLRERLLALGY